MPFVRNYGESMLYRGGDYGAKSWGGKYIAFVMMPRMYQYTAMGFRAYGERPMALGGNYTSGNQSGLFHFEVDAKYYKQVDIYRGFRAL